MMLKLHRIATCYVKLVGNQVTGPNDMQAPHCIEFARYVCSIPGGIHTLTTSHWSKRASVSFLVVVRGWVRQCKW